MKIFDIIFMNGCFLLNFVYLHSKKKFKYEKRNNNDLYGKKPK